jgi:hypothetical protein
MIILDPIFYRMLFYDFRSMISPREKHLSIIFFELKVATSNSHDALVGLVVYVASHGGSLGHTFDMVGHDPSMLEIPAKLHASNQVNPTPRANLRHLKTKTLFVLSPWPGN